MTGIVIAENCHTCGRPTAPIDLVPLGESMKRCRKCIEQHEIALEILAGQRPEKAECGECHITFKELALQNGGRETPMHLHMKDNVYQFLCDLCQAAFQLKVRERYRDTRYGKKHGLTH